MTGMDLLDAMEHVDPKLIEAAENPPVKKKKVVPFVWTGVAAAACVAVIAGVSFVVVQSRSMTGNTAPAAEVASAPAAEAEVAAEAEAAAEEATPEVMEDAADAMPEAAMDAGASDAGAMLSPASAEESAKQDDSVAVENAADLPTQAQIIAQLNEELQKLAAGENGFTDIELVLQEGKPVMNVTISKEQAELYDTDHAASDAFDRVLVELAGQMDGRLKDYAITDNLSGTVTVDGETEPYRVFDTGHVWSSE